jgi:hypothetical protein
LPYTECSTIPPSKKEAAKEREREKNMNIMNLTEFSQEMKIVVAA